MHPSASSLPESWVHTLWSELRANYGARWDRTFPVPPCPPGVDPAQHAHDHVQSIQAVWAKRLGHLQANPKAIRFALDNLPEDPPTLPEFSEACRVAAVNRRDQALALAAPGGTVTTREEAAEILAKIGYSAPAKPRVDPKAWAHRVLARAAAGDETLALESIRMAERAIKAKDAA